MRSKKRTYVPATPVLAGRVPAYDGLYILDINENYDGRDAARIIQAVNGLDRAAGAGFLEAMMEAADTLENIAQRQLMIATHTAEKLMLAERAVSRLQAYIDEVKTEEDEADARRDRAEARAERRTVALEQMAANARVAEVQYPALSCNTTVFNTPGADEECGCCDQG